MTAMLRNCLQRSTLRSCERFLRRIPLTPVLHQSFSQIECFPRQAIDHTCPRTHGTFETQTPFNRNARICRDNAFSYNQLRFKSKDIKKTKGKKKVDINPEQLAKIMDMESYKKQLQSTIDNMRDDFIKNLSLRSTTGSIETLEVKFDGKVYTLQELAQIIRKNPKTIALNMSTFPQAITVALAAIKESGMNLNPQQDGTMIYIPVPKVTREHRELLAKNAKALFTKYRETLKELQNKNLRNIKRMNNVSTDLVHDVQTLLADVTDTYVHEAEKVLETKRNELIGDK